MGECQVRAKYKYEFPKGCLSTRFVDRLTDDLWGLVLEFVLANINGGWQDLYGCGWARCQRVSKDFQRYILRPQNGNDYIIECFKRRHLHSAHTATLWHYK